MKYFTEQKSGAITGLIVSETLQQSYGDYEIEEITEAEYEQIRQEMEKPQSNPLPTTEERLSAAEAALLSLMEVIADV